MSRFGSVRELGYLVLGVDDEQRLSNRLEVAGVGPFGEVFDFRRHEVAGATGGRVVRLVDGVEDGMAEESPSDVSCVQDRSCGYGEGAEP